MLSHIARLGLVSPVVAMVGLLAAPAVAQNATPAMYTWTKGDQQFFRWTEQTKGKLAGSPGMESETTSARVSTVTWDVTDVKDGIATIKVTYNGISLETQMPKGPVAKYDSLSPQGSDSPVLTSVFGPIVGESFTFMVDGKGNVSKVEGMKAVTAKLKEKAKDVQGSSTYLNELNNSMSDERIKKNLERVISGGSDTAVKVGDTWSDSLELPLPQPTLGSMKTERQMTLKSIDAGVATIGFAIKISHIEPKEGDPAKAMFDMVKPKMDNATGTGERIINEKGQIVKSAFTLNVPIDITMPGQDMKIKNTMNMMLSLEKLDKAPVASVPQAPPAAPAPPAGASPNLGNTPPAKK
ncbi:MAG: hypothetical protein H7210_14420 [Pyrinomonadaceae bacterium]|nr:hypothetical protein [Phycisphaerales bacterium]